MTLKSKTLYPVGLGRSTSQAASSITTIARTDKTRLDIARVSDGKHERVSICVQTKHGSYWSSTDLGVQLPVAYANDLVKLLDASVLCAKVTPDGDIYTISPAIRIAPGQRLCGRVRFDRSLEIAHLQRADGKFHIKCKIAIYPDELHQVRRALIHLDAAVKVAA